MCQMLIVKTTEFERNPFDVIEDFSGSREAKIRPIENCFYQASWSIGSTRIHCVTK